MASVKITDDLHVAKSNGRFLVLMLLDLSVPSKKVVLPRAPGNPHFWDSLLSWFSSSFPGHCFSVSSAGSSPSHWIQTDQSSVLRPLLSPPTPSPVSRFQFTCWRHLEFLLQPRPPPSPTYIHSTCPFGCQTGIYSLTSSKPNYWYFTLKPAPTRYC